MNNLMDKRFYKVISLFIKTILLLASFYYVIQKLSTHNAFTAYYAISFSPRVIGYLITAVILMFVNWNLEAKKWQVLIARYEVISLRQSLQSIFAGVTISIFTPNRVGEFTGRIFFLKKADKFIASIRSLVGSFTQLVITIIFGLFAVGLYVFKGYDKVVPLLSILNSEKKYMPVLLLLCAAVSLMIIIRGFFFSKFRYYFKEIFTIKRRDLMQALWLSILRYIVFTFQYFLLLKAVGIEIQFFQSCIFISIIFLINAAIPSFALTEIVVRSAVAVYVFGAFPYSQPVLVASASLLLWMINLAIPALIGSAFIGKFQFFKAH